MPERTAMQLRLPPDLKTWLARQAHRNGCSMNAEIVRLIRAAADQVTKGETND